LPPFHISKYATELQEDGRRPPIREAISQQAADTVDWTVRCDWL